MIKYLIIFSLISSQIYSYAENNLNEYTHKIDRIEKDLNILQKQFYKNNKGKNLSVESIDTGATNLEIRISNIEEQIRSLIGNQEKLEHLINQQDENLKKFQEDIEFRINEIEDNASKQIAKETKEATEIKEDKKQKEPSKKIILEPVDPKLQNDNSLGKIKQGAVEKITQELDQKKSAAKQEFDLAFNLIKANKFTEAEDSFKKNC